MCKPQFDEGNTRFNADSYNYNVYYKLRIQNVQ